MNRYKKHYNNIVCYDLIFKDHFINIMQLPKIDNIILNIGLGKNAILDKKQIVTTLTALELITGQKSCQTRAKKSIDKFKLRQNMPIGCKVTLRNKNMFNFMDKLTNKVLPNMDEISDLIASTETRRKKTNIASNLFVKKGKDFLQKRYFYFEPSINKALQNKVGIQQKKMQEETTTNLAIGGCSRNISLGDSSKVLDSFLLLHFFNNISIATNASNLSRRKKCLFSKKASNENILSINFGISDFFYFNDIPYDKFSSNSSYGLNIIIRITSLKKKKSNHLLYPNYLLSSFQLPLGISS
jgi:ribosomal protein L5